MKKVLIGIVLSLVSIAASAQFVPGVVLKAADLNAAIARPNIVGGAINNTPIGSAVPATGAFTTLNTGSIIGNTATFNSISVPTITTPTVIPHTIIMKDGVSTVGNSAIATTEFVGTTNRYYVGDGNGYDFRFVKRSAGVDTDLLTIADNGVTNFSETINVTENEAMRIYGDSAYITFHNAAKTARSGYIQFNATNQASIFVEANQDLVIYNNSIETMRFKKNNTMVFTGMGAGGLMLNGAGTVISEPAIRKTFVGVTPSIGGASLPAGTCIGASVNIPGAAATMAVEVSPAGIYPGDTIFWRGLVTVSDTVVVKVCATVTATPNATTYNIRVIQ